ncbi:hypothetical protein CCUS01_01559 [Colletotrichum cuscutae]|uniref:Uncharacterized protein n=1 Tax=Colletotrichum cuscutae TaxID=1209917 RepID=A0AAI9USB4_9PEZI|nr:hypothetical protein CCUS01_01559 [Colletotrichum cuscutae]
MDTPTVSIDLFFFLDFLTFNFPSYKVHNHGSLTAILGVIFIYIVIIYTLFIRIVRGVYIKKSLKYFFISI